MEVITIDIAESILDELKSILSSDNDVREFFILVLEGSNDVAFRN